MKEFENGLNEKFSFDFSAPSVSDINIEKLKSFLKKDDVLIFYGGEPLLQIEKIKKILDNIDVKFRMQTNGKLLDKLPIEYLKKIGKILISLDGDKKRTDYNRGQGTYDLVLENVRKIQEQSYNGELIARMVISQEFPDIYEQTKFLVEAGFSSVHWQLDSGFYKFDFNKEKFSEFVKEYNKSITKLIEYWIEKMKEGKVLRLYPFMGVVESLLKKEKTLLRCGAGHSGYSITTNGKVIACPIMNNIKEFEAGDLNSNELKKFQMSGRCLKCDIKDVCGGRCLYWNRANLWPEKGDDLICKTIKHLINELKKQLPQIESLIKDNIIRKEDFEYEKYFGPEIIP
jgi:putative peptide-modifying radical SAM enzyme